MHTTLIRSPRASKLALALATVSLLSACKAKISAEDPGPPAVKPFTHDVKGPSLDGTWKSGCERDIWGSGYVVFEMVIKDQDTVRTETKYVDMNCSQKTETILRDGWFRYAKDYGADVFEVEYKFKMPNGHYYTGETISRVGAKLMISDRRIGNQAIPNIQLNLVLN